MISVYGILMWNDNMYIYQWNIDFFYELNNDYASTTYSLNTYASPPAKKYI